MASTLTKEEIYSNGWGDKELVVTTPEDVETHELLTQTKQPKIYEFLPTHPKLLDPPHDPVQLDHILLRVLKVGSIPWSTAAGRGESLTTIFLPSTLISNPGVKSTLNLFRYLKAGFRIEVRVTGTRAHYGQIIVSYRPLANGWSMSTEAKRTRYLTQASNGPFMTVSPNCSTSCELIVPFVYPNRFYDMTESNALRIGDIHVHVLSPLRGSDLDANIEIYANFIDPEIYCPGNFDHPSMPATTSNNYIIPEAIDRSDVGTLYEAHGRCGNDTEAIEKSKQGIISSTLTSLSSFAHYLSSIPILTPYALPTEVVCESVASVTQLFGYDNPLDQSTIGRFRNITVDVARSEGISTALPLSLTPNPTVHPAPEILGSFPDEMSFDYLFSIPSLERIYSSQDIATKSLDINPLTNMYHPFEEVYEKIPSVLESLVLPFALWRGSIKYRFEAVTSPFHAGKLRIIFSFEPSITGVYDVNKCYSIVWNLAENPVLDFIVPYISNQHWQRTMIERYRDPTRFFGTMYFEWEAPLSYTEAPIPPVDIIIYKSAGPDFQVAGPSFRNISYYDRTDYPGYVPQYIAQVGSRSEIMSAKPITIGPTTGYKDQGLCVAESPTHVSQLIKRYCYVGEMNGDVSGAADREINQFGMIHPAQGAGSNGAILHPVSLMDYYRTLFLFSRGSVEYALIANPIGQNIEKTSGFIRGKWVRHSGTPPEVNRSNTSTTSRHCMVDGMALSSDLALQPLEINIPYMSKNSFFLNQIDGHRNTSSNYYSKDVMVAEVMITGGHATLMKRAGDDYRLGFFLGPLPQTVDSNPPLPSEFFHYDHKL